MTSFCFAVFLCVLLYFSRVDGDGDFIEATGRIVKNKYVVVLDEDLTVEQQREHVSKIFEIADKVLEERPKIEKELNIGDNFKAYSAIMNNATLQRVLQLPHVRYVMPDQIIQLRDYGISSGDELHNEFNQRLTNPDSCQTQTGADWGLERTCEKEFSNNKKYIYSAQYQGQNVDVYVIDTGVYPNADFEGRARIVKDYVYNNVSVPDTDGHGTLVASLIIGKKFGIAKMATVAAVRIIDDDGYASIETIVESIQWVASEARRLNRTIVLNFSVGVPRNAAVDNASNAAIRDGVALVAAAGNEGDDAVKTSPAGIQASITVAGSDIQDKFMVTPKLSSNYGSCVDIFAPSRDILGAGINGQTSTKTDSGTSFGTPLVSGILARMLSQNPSKTPAQLKNDLIAMASNGILCPPDGEEWPPRTVNRLVYMGCS